MADLVVRKFPIAKENKVDRNFYLIDEAIRFAKEQGWSANEVAIAIGTYQDSEEPQFDLDPSLLQQRAGAFKIFTWESFGQCKNRENWLRMVSVHLTETEKQALMASTSCQLWFKKACGRCFSCKDRKNAFLKVWGNDPTEYLEGR